ncbi:MAG TPA: gas vesicle structural protein GvpA [Terriglobales bacterium]|nr:gas vesicle structural protein GvpA [Terriglobales bacterium]
MAVERVSGGSSLIDVLDRVLDKGIVIDAWVRISLVGIDLITVEARVVVASIDTYLKYADAVGLTGLVSRPQLAGVEEEETETVEPTRRTRVTTRAAARR